MANTFNDPNAPIRAKIINPDGTITHPWVKWFLQVLPIKRISSLPVYANNTAATAGGLKSGDLYRTNGDPDTICVVH